MVSTVRRSEHPEFQGAAAVVASAPGGEYYVYGPETASSQVLLSLGFAILVDVDLLLWLEAADDPGPATLRADPLYRRLPVAAQGRDLFLGYDVHAGALSFSSVLSLPFLLDELVPAMSAAVDGDPTTTPDLPA